MSQILELPHEVYCKLAQGAADRGMTIQSLLTIVSDLIVLPDEPTKADRQQYKRIDRLLERFRKGRLDTKGRAELDVLIQGEYQAANIRADQLINAKQRRDGNRQLPERKPNGSTRSAKRSR